MIIHNLQKKHLESWFHKTLKVCLLAELREAVRAAQNVRSGILIFSNLARPGVLILMKRATPESADDSVSYGGAWRARRGVAASSGESLQERRDASGVAISSSASDVGCRDMPVVQQTPSPT